MVLTLEALEALSPGETMAAILPREPIFLLKELDNRGHQWRGTTTDDGSYRIVIRAGDVTSAAS